MAIRKAKQQYSSLYTILSINLTTMKQRIKMHGPLMRSGEGERGASDWKFYHLVVICDQFLILGYVQFFV